MQPADADAFAALVRAAFAGLPVVPAPSAARLTADELRVHFRAGGGGIITTDRLAGLLWSEREGGLYLSRLAVHVSLRRHGLAAAMIAMADGEARRRGLRRVWLSTRLALTANRRLFIRCGFTEGATDAHPGYTTPTLIVLDRWLDSEPTAAPDVEILHA